jgi:hypothetical protein
MRFVFLIPFISCILLCCFFGVANLIRGDTTVGIVSIVVSLLIGLGTLDKLFTQDRYKDDKINL